MLGSGAADQHVAAMAVPGQQWQQVAGGEQVRQQVFVQAPAQELLGLVDQPPALDVAADRGDHARYGAVEVAQPLRQRGGFTVAGDRGVDHGQVGAGRSEEHTSELQSLMRTSYALLSFKKKRQYKK